MVHAVLGSVAKHVVNGVAAILRGTMFTDVLDAPVTELAVGHNIDVGQHFIDAGTLLKVSIRPPSSKGSSNLIFFQTVFKDVLHDQTPSLAKSYIVPHSAQGLIDVLHNLWGRVGPAQLEQLLPHMARVTMDDRLRDTAQELVDHDGFVLFWNGIKCLLDHMAAKGIHAQAKRIATDSVGNGDDLLRRSMFEATLDQEVPEAVDHQRVGLRDNGFDDFILLLHGANFELLLQED